MLPKKGFLYLRATLFLPFPHAIFIMCLYFLNNLEKNVALLISNKMKYFTINPAFLFCEAITVSCKYQEIYNTNTGQLLAILAPF